MKKIALLLPCIIMSVLIASTQNPVKPVNSSTGFGFQLNQYQNDFGFGISITSPLIIKNRAAVRLRGNLMYNEYIENESTHWEPYTNLSLGLLSLGGKVSERIRLYGEGGFIFIFPPDKISDDNLVFGGYGIFGFEFFMSHSGNYFIELGGIGTGATAEKVENKPIYSNGFLISTGLRFYLN